MSAVKEETDEKVRTIVKTIHWSPETDLLSFVALNHHDPLNLAIFYEQQWENE